jgi:predicted nucleic acid-binding protein
VSNAQLILDTYVVSYVMKGHPLAEAYMPIFERKLLAIAFITVEEMYYGAEKAQWSPEKRSKLETTLRNFLVIPYDHEIARCYGRLMAERQSDGRTIAPNDAWIAACATRHRVPLVTNNAKHFDGINGLKVITANEG